MANYDLTYEGSRVQGILDTGNSLKDAGYIFRGEATPSTVPGTSTERVAYIGGPGTYTNFGSSITVGAGCVCIFKYTGSAWSNQVINTGLDSAVNTLQSAITAINNNIGNGYVYAGVATPSTSPVTGKVFYLAVTAGTYTNFGNAVVSAGLNVIKYNGSAWSVDQVIAIDAEPTQGSANLVKSGGVLGSIIQNGPAFDLSAYNAQGGVLATYADLSAALTALNALPSDFKKCGMSFKFVQSSDNNYVEFRCIVDEFTTDVTKWKNIDDEPLAKSVSYNLSALGYGKIELKDFVQGIRISSAPFVVVSNPDAITSVIPIRLHKYDEIVFHCPSGKRIQMILSNGGGTNLSASDIQYTANVEVDVFLNMANAESSPLTPEGAEVEVTYKDNSSNIAHEKDLVDARLQTLILASELSIAGYVASNGAIYASNDTHRTGFIPVKEGYIVHYKSQGVNGFNLLAFYTEKDASTYVEGTGNVSETTYTVPQDGYIIITCLDSFTEGYLYVEPRSDYKKKVTDKQFGDIISEIDNIKGFQKIMLSDLADSITIAGYVVSGTNAGKIYNGSSDTKRTDFIKVSSGQKFNYDLRGIDSFLVIAFYTSKSESSYVSNSGVVGNGAANHVSGVYTVPQDGYIILTSMNSYAEDACFYLEDGLTELEHRVTDVENKVGLSDLTGRYILNFGDSLANGDGNAGRSYADMIADGLNATLLDYSVSGAPFAAYDWGEGSSPYCVLNRVKQAISDHSTDDIAAIFIEGAINDLKNIVLDIGTITDNYDGVYAENMIIGAAESAFYLLKSTFPTAKIVFIMYHHMPIQTNTVTYEQMLGRQDQEHEAFKAVCTKWSIPMADVFAEGLLNSNIQSMAEEYFGVNADEKFGRDIAHPNAKGYRKFYVPLIEAKLNISTFE